MCARHTGLLREKGMKEELIGQFCSVRINAVYTPAAHRVTVYLLWSFVKLDQKLSTNFASKFSFNRIERYTMNCKSLRMAQ